MHVFSRAFGSFDAPHHADETDSADRAQLLTGFADDFLDGGVDDFIRVHFVLCENFLGVIINNSPLTSTLFSIF